MELRHLRYFVAVVEEGSSTTAAEAWLHTSQPSLSRQIRDLEYEVGAELLSRSVHGVELTAAGKAFLDRARLAQLPQFGHRKKFSATGPAVASALLVSRARDRRVVPTARPCEPQPFW